MNGKRQRSLMREDHVFEAFSIPKQRLRRISLFTANTSVKVVKEASNKKRGI